MNDTDTKTSSETANQETGLGALTKSSKQKKAAKQDPSSAEPQIFAVVRSGGKQYRVTAGSRLSVEKLELEVGSLVTFDDVLMVGKEGGTDVRIATPTEALSVKVVGKVLGQNKDKKVIIFKKRRRAGYTKKQGHRQQKTEILVETISL